MILDQMGNDRSLTMNNAFLHEDDLTEKAKNLFDYHYHILDTFESYRQNILRDENVAPAGRSFLPSELQSLDTHCKRVMNYVTEHQYITKQSLPLY
ncbi:unnamed protein product [Rotaria magnacalcarata]|uniref:Uncharacterized protein n=2 Tax=Rotaria magnacalcarata TaxID=392030 RepID=A0A816Y9H8_9BILA|nr:unnamed protein product [Rotaria magnacalcarata]